MKDPQAFVDYLRDEFGKSCEFLTVVELAPDYLDGEPTRTELLYIHDLVVNGD